MSRSEANGVLDSNSTEKQTYSPYFQNSLKDSLCSWSRDIFITTLERDFLFLFGWERFSTLPSAFSPNELKDASIHTHIYIYIYIYMCVYLYMAFIDFCFWHNDQGPFCTSVNKSYLFIVHTHIHTQRMLGLLCHMFLNIIYECIKFE